MERGRAVAGLAMIVLAGVVLAGWSPWSWATPWSSEEHRDELAAGITAVRLDDIGAGDVRVRTGDRQRTSVTAHVRTGWWGDGDRSFERDGDVLVLDECRGCTVDYELVVPRGTTVSGESGSGTAVLEGVRGVDVTSSSGDVRGSSLAGPVMVETSSGDVELDLATPQDVRASTSSGNVDLTVPDGRYRVDADGDADVDVIDDPDARHELVLETSSGDVRAGAR